MAELPPYVVFQLTLKSQPGAGFDVRPEVTAFQLKSLVFDMAAFMNITFSTAYKHHFKLHLP